VGSSSPVVSRPVALHPNPCTPGVPSKARSGTHIPYTCRGVLKALPRPEHGALTGQQPLGRTMGALPALHRTHSHAVHPCRGRRGARAEPLMVAPIGRVGGKSC
jgi:hypothetical protein